MVTFAVATIGSVAGDEGETAMFDPGSADAPDHAAFDLVATFPPQLHIRGYLFATAAAATPSTAAVASALDCFHRIRRAER